MSIIYSFLQKRKMHESQHGIVMVITAYALSVVMLVLGSDAFYNINSAAAGINMDTVEETQKVLSEELQAPQSIDISTQVLQSNLINPYGLTETSAKNALTEETSTENTSTKDTSTEDTVARGDSISFLGNAINIDEYASIIAETKDINSISSAILTSDATEIETSDTTESFSVKETISSSAIAATKTEIDMLERIVEAEATGEDMVGKILIVNVIYNRMADEEFPDTVKSVIFQNVHGDYQFSPVSDERYWSVKITGETEEAVQRALEGEDYSKGALYFIARKRTNASSAKWFDQHLDWLFKHGGHEFYKNK